jgi:hypothetical protein
MAMTRALGQQVAPQGEQPEVFRWTDNGGSHVTCEFQDGRLTRWTLWRPPAEDETASGGADPAGH